MTKANIWDIWNRAETGPVCPTKKFEIHIVYPKIKELVKTYEVEYDPETIVPIDDTLIDAVYQAGMELLLEVGILCTTTEKIIKFEESEVKSILRALPSEAILGEGKDVNVIRSRTLEDKHPPSIGAGPSGGPISEEMALKIYQSYAQEPLNDNLNGGFITTINGREVKAGSPLEMYAEMYSTSLMREAMRRAGRPGMSIRGSQAVTVRGAMAPAFPEWGRRKGDALHAWLLPVLKTDYDSLCRAYYWLACGYPIWGGGMPTVGGFSGGPEGTAITCAAEMLAARILYQASLCIGTAAHSFYTGTTSRELLWTRHLASAAINKNTNIPTIVDSPYITYSGPCTEMSLYETAAATIGATVTGGATLVVGSGRQGVHTDYCAGLDSRFAGEIKNTVTKMRLKRSDANDLVKSLLAKYENRIKERNPPIGKKFQECYDVATVTPSKEFLELYDKIKKELEVNGLEFG